MNTQFMLFTIYHWGPAKYWHYPTSTKWTREKLAYHKADHDACHHCRNSISRKWIGEKLDHHKASIKDYNPSQMFHADREIEARILSNHQPVSDAEREPKFENVNMEDFENQDSKNKQVPKLMFKHESLDLQKDEFRVLKLSSALQGGFIQCKLLKRPIGKKHVCLSYTWGPEDAKRQEILINGRKFKVRQNLFDFLDVARTMLPSNSWLWIDAICIDQTNDSEKIHEIRRMPRLFGNAKYVISWLGKGDDDAARAVNFLKLSEPEWVARPHLEQPCTYAHTLECISMIELLAQKMDTMSYWNRLWIVPEVIHARKLYLCLGSTMFEWENLEYLASWKPNEHHLSLAETECYNIKFVDFKNFARHADSRPRFSLCDLIEVHGFRQCRDVKDRVWALSSLVENPNRFLPKTYNTSPTELWMHIMSFYIQEEKSHCVVPKKNELPELDVRRRAMKPSSTRLFDRGLTLAQVLEVELDVVQFQNLLRTSETQDMVYKRLTIRPSEYAEFARNYRYQGYTPRNMFESPWLEALQ